MKPVIITAQDTREYAHLGTVLQAGDVPAFICYCHPDGSLDLCEGGVHTQARTAQAEADHYNRQWSGNDGRYVVVTSLAGARPVDSTVLSSFTVAQKIMIENARESLLEQNGPSIAREMVAIASGFAGCFVAVALTYTRENNGVRVHRTLRAAHRALGSMVNSSRGKLNRRDFFAACIVTPDGRVLNWTEAKRIINA